MTRFGSMSSIAAPGIGQADIGAVTEPFLRPDAVRTRDAGGVGLGLSLARLIAEAHGGTLVVASDPAREPGTRVPVTLPIDTPVQATDARRGGHALWTVRHSSSS